MKKIFLSLSAATLVCVAQAQDVPTVVLTHSKIASSEPLPRSIGSFRAGEAIYGMIHTKESISDIIGPYSCKFTERVYVDGEAQSEYEYSVSYGDIRDLGHFYEISISPSLDRIEYPKQAFNLSQGLSGISSGKHDVKVVVSYQVKGLSESNTLGSLLFEYDCSSEEGIAQQKKMVQAYRSKTLKNVSLPSAGMTNSNLEAGIQKAVNAANWNQEILKVIIMDYDWQYMTHSVWGTVTDRYLNVAVVVKDADGNCIIFYPTVLQTKIDGGDFATTFTLGGMHQIEKYIDCSNVN